jgi:hypothetical protein
MNVGRKVDVAPLCRRALDLFRSAHEAWCHLTKHVLDAREAWSWAVLIPALQAALAAGERDGWHGQARTGSADKVPADLAAVWAAFLDLVAAAAEQGGETGVVLGRSIQQRGGPLPDLRTDGYPRLPG